MTLGLNDYKIQTELPLSKEELAELEQDIKNYKLHIANAIIEAKKIYIHDNLDKVYSCTMKSIFSELLEVAGGSNNE